MVELVAIVLLNGSPRSLAFVNEVDECLAILCVPGLALLDLRWPVTEAPGLLGENELPRFDGVKVGPCG